MKLTHRQLKARCVALSGMTIAALGLRVVDPDSVSWLRPSCGAITGLPCIFCGATRALHYLLHGHFAQALYFNWLVFPLALLAVGLAGKIAAELWWQRQLPPSWPAPRLTPRLAFIIAGGVAALWVAQVSLALGLHKHELLNAHGMLYPLLVR